MEEEVRKRPQDDVPAEVIIHYIVKDYQNMWKKFHELEPSMKKKRETLQKYRAKIRELLHELRERQIEAMPESGLKKAMKSVINRASNAELKNDRLQKENEALQKRIDEIRTDRSSVVEAMTGELEEQLAEANRKIELLSQAVVDPSKADSVFLQSCKVHTIETDDDKKWMVGAAKQLEKAGMKLLTIEEQLIRYEEKLKESGNIYTEKVIKPLGKAISNINSTISHIECFLEKTGEIKIEE